jgi:hypothetical protein
MTVEQQPATYEPIIVSDAVFHVERVLNNDGEVLVRMSDRVEPTTEISSTMVAAGRPVMFHIARELDIDPGAVSRYLTKPVGSTFEEGEPVARVRRGLRSVTCYAPATVTMSSLDQTNGVATLIPESTPRHLYAAVYGEVETIVERRGAVVRVTGSRVQGFLGLGADAFGQLKVAVDRPDRELTADMIDDEFRDAIALGGMTLGTTALRRLLEVGARGVVVGSVSDSEIRRFVSDGEIELNSMALWRRGARDFHAPGGSASQPLTLFVTEGFGRRRMAQPLFKFLSELENQVASILIPDDCSVISARPSLYLASNDAGGRDTIQRVTVRSGTIARLTDPEHLGVVVTCRSGIIEDPRRPGIGREVVDVEFSNGTSRLVPAVNLEVIQP